MLYEYQGGIYPNYLKQGGAKDYIERIALNFCTGVGIDIGAGSWPLEGAVPVELKEGVDGCDLPSSHTNLDFIFSSHCLEHIVRPADALRHWFDRLKPGGVLFLYLPHHEMKYWLPQNCEKHIHSWTPGQAVNLVQDCGFSSVIHSERDLFWSFAVVGFKGGC